MPAAPSIDKISKWILENDKPRLLIGIDGLAGSGKSTLAGQIQSNFASVEVVTYDDLYLSADQMPDFLADPWGIAAAYDWPALRDGVLQPFQKGEGLTYPVLDWNNQTRSIRTIPNGAKILIVEGVSSTMPKIRAFYDLRVWVTAPYELRLARGVERDGEGMRWHWTDVWMPAEEIYLRECQPDHHAHLSVSGTN